MVEYLTDLDISIDQSRVSICKINQKKSPMKTLLRADAIHEPRMPSEHARDQGEVS